MLFSGTSLMEKKSDFVCVQGRELVCFSDQLSGAGRKSNNIWKARGIPILAILDFPQIIWCHLAFYVCFCVCKCTFW